MRRMARALAHSLRNPLGSVRSSAELAGCSDDEMVRKHAQDIVTQVDFLSQWVRELLLYTHPLAGEREAVDVCAVLESVLSSFLPTLERGGIRLQWDRNPLCHTPVQGNTALARQALHSVISNAVENMAAMQTALNTNLAAGFTPARRMRLPWFTSKTPVGLLGTTATILKLLQ